MKKTIVFVLTTIMIVGLCACGQKVDTSVEQKNDIDATPNNVIMTVSDNGNEVDKEIIETVPTPAEEEETEPTPEVSFLDENDDTDKSDSVTAAMLIDGLKDIDVQYIDGNCKMVMDVSDSKSSANVTLDMDVVANTEWTHANTVTKMSGQSVEVETWMNNKTGQCYSLVTGVEGWQTSQAQQITDYTNLGSNLDSAKCDKLEFSDITDDYYEVSAIIPAEAALEMLNANGGTTGTLDMSNVTYNAVYRFDKETQQLLYVKINVILS